MLLVVRERWKWVPEFKGIYAVSNRGRVRSVNRWTEVTRIKNSKEETYRQFHKGKILTPSTDRDGYQFVSLSKPGGYYPYRVHQLVLSAFVGPCPAGMVIRHFPDRNPTNNNLTNLKYGTPQENADDRIIHGTLTVNQGEKHGMAKLTEAKVIELRKLYATGQWTQRALAVKFGLAGSGPVSQIVNRKIWRHVP